MIDGTEGNTWRTIDERFKANVKRKAVKRPGKIRNYTWKATITSYRQGILAALTNLRDVRSDRDLIKLIVS